MNFRALRSRQKLALLALLLLFPLLGKLFGETSYPRPSTTQTQSQAKDDPTDAASEESDVFVEELPGPGVRQRLTDQLLEPMGTASRKGFETNRLRLGEQDKIEIVQYEDVLLAEAMKLFSEQTGLNVITSAEAGQTRVNVYLRDVKPLAALEAIVKANGLFYRIDEESEIVRIATAKEYERDLTSFREDETRVFTLLYPNPVAVAQVISQVFGSRVEMNTADTDGEELVDLSQRFSRFDLVDGRSLGLGTFENNNQAGNGRFGNQFGSNNSLNSQLGLGLGMGVSGGLGGVNSLRNRSRNQQNTSRKDPRSEGLTTQELRAIESQLARGSVEERGQAQQAARRDEATIYVSTIRRNNQIIVRTSDPRSMKEIEQLVEKLDVPTPTVLLEVKVLRVTLADGMNSAFEYFAGNGQQSASFETGSRLPSFPGEAGASRLLSKGLGVSGKVPGALTFQIVDDRFQFRMQALESQRRVTALATPLILTANNEVSRIFVGDTLPFTVGFTPSQVAGGINSGSAVAATPITELRDVGQSLLITPNINADRTVTLRVVEENSERVLGGASIPVPDAEGSGVTSVNVDTVRRRTVSGTVVAQDGRAVALGGLIEENVDDSQDRIPVLGNIPGLGFLFRRTASTRSRSELVVVIRPYVFNTPSESAATTHSMLSELSLHPNSEKLSGTMNTYMPCKVVRSDAECMERAKLMQWHGVDEAYPSATATLPASPAQTGRDQ